MFIGIGGRIIELSNLPGTSRPGGTVIIPLSISYDQTAYCADASNPTPTVAGNEGAGTYSSTTGIVFADSGTNTGSSTGIINISSSTPGATYVITYTDTNAATATFDFTLNALDNASFAYSASSYEPTDADPTPTITGLTGGTFSSTSGLVFVDSGTNTGSSTGEIDLSATTEASYTITYDTTSSGSSVCPNTSTQSVEVAVANIANNYSMAFDGVNDYINAGNGLGSINNVYNGDLTVSLWYKKNAINYTNILGNNPKSIYQIRGNLYIALINSNLRFAINGDSGYRIDHTITTDTNWHHLVCVVTYDSVAGNFDLKMYHDGSIVSGTYTGTQPITGDLDFNGPTYIGVADPNHAYNKRFFGGNLDEVAVWNTELTATQVSEIYSATSAGLTKDLSTVSGSNLKLWLRMGD